MGFQSKVIKRLGIPPNYTEVMSDGSLRYRGDAKLVVNLNVNLVGQRANASAGKIDANWDENGLDFQSGGSISNTADRVVMNIPIGTNLYVGNNIPFRPTIKWFQWIGSGSFTQYVFTLQYRKQNVGYSKTASWTTISTTVNSTNNRFDYTGEVDGYYNQVTRFPEIQLDINIGDTIQFRLARTDSLSGTLTAISFRLLALVDSDGANDINTKYP